MKRTTEFYKQLEQLSYYVYHEKKYSKPAGWTSVKSYKNDLTGFYAEAFKSPNGKIFLVFRGTDMNKGPLEAGKDLYSDLQLSLAHLPVQMSDVYKATEDIISIYGYENVGTCGYSLGATESAIISNEYGLESVNFSPYAVGTYVIPKYDENITNFGNEADPIFAAQLPYQIGETYVIPNEENIDYAGTNFNPSLKDLQLQDLNKHFPNQIGDISKAVKYEGYVMESPMVLKGSVYHEDFDDSIFDYKNRVYYKSELLPLDEFEKEDIDAFWDQALSKEGLPTKEELDARSRMGELIYVESYVRSDGTKVSGYYRKCPR